MKNFLDSCVVIHYSNYVDEKSKKIIKKCFEFVENKERFILCYASLKEISNFKKKRKRVHKEVIKKLKNPEHNFAKNLDFRSISTAKQLYISFKDKDPVEVASHLQEQRENSNIRIDKFTTTLVNEKVIPLEKIDNNLVKKIHDMISNYADCKILASALQLQKNRDLFLFVTADKDFNSNEYDFLKGHFEINYSKENWKFPKLLNLLYEI